MLKLKSGGETAKLNEKKDYCIGIDAIKEYGIMKWHDEFFMPFSVNDYNMLFEKIYNTYKGLLRSDMTEDSKDILYAMSRVVFKFAHLFHMHFMDYFLKSGGFNILFSEEVRFKKFNVDLVRRTLSQPDKADLRNIVNNVLSRASSLDRNKICLNMGARVGLKARYAKEDKFFIRYEPLNRFLRSADSINGKLIEEFEYIMDKFLETGKELFSYFNIEDRGGEVLRNINGIIADDLMLAMRLYLGTKLHIKRTKYDYVFAASLGSPLVRIILKSFQAAGKKVISFTHGNPTGIFYDRSLLLNIFPVSDTYIVPSRGIEDFFRDLPKAHKDFPLPREVAIKAVNDDYYAKIWQREKRKPLVRKTKKVMFLESTINPHFPVLHKALYYPIQLDLNLRILEVLKRYGYSVIVKLHPARLKESDNGGIYKGLADNCESRRFEDVYGKADAYIFPHLFTTTFGFSLATNKKIIYFHYEKEKFIQEKIDLLNKRCRPVHCRFDKRNRIIFDEKELIDALESEHARVDTEFLEKQLL